MTPRFNQAVAESFLSLLGKPAGAPTRIRGIRKGIATRKAFYDPAVIQRWMDDGLHVYAVIGNGGDDKASILSCPAYFAEYDDGSSPQEQLQRILAADLPTPSFVVRTGGKSHHFYWRTDPDHPYCLDWQREMKQLIALIGSDRSVNDPSRLMRLPGTVHQATGNPVELLPPTGIIHPLNAMRALLEPPPPPTRATQPFRADTFTTHSRSIERALEQLQRVPERIPGSNTRDIYLRLLWALTDLLGADQAAALMTSHSPAWAAAEDIRKLAAQARGDIKSETFFHLVRAHWGVTSPQRSTVPSEWTAPLPPVTIPDVPVTPPTPTPAVPSAPVPSAPVGSAPVPPALRPQVEALRAADASLATIEDMAAAPDVSLADFLPPGLADALTRRAASFPTDPNAFILPLLSAVGSIIGNRLRVQFKVGHTESMAIWGVNIQDASAMKSPVFGVITGPLHTWEAEFRKANRAERDKWKADRAAAANGETGAAAKELQNQWELDNPAPDPARQLIVADATLERVGQLLAEPGTTGLLQFADELMSWLSSMKRGKDSVDQRGNWLSSWSGGALKVSRIGRDDVIVRYALLCILGGMQPSAFRQLRENARANGQTVRDGLYARMLVWMPRRLPYDPDAAPYDCRDLILSFYRQLDALAPVLEEDAMPKLIRFSSDAFAVFAPQLRAWDRMVMGSPDTERSEWIGKMRGYSIRLAGLLHCIDCAARELPLIEEISGDTARKAIDLCHALMSQYALACIELDVETDLDEADPMLQRFVKRLAEWRKTNPDQQQITLQTIGRMGFPRRRAPASEVAPWLEQVLNHHPRLGEVHTSGTGKGQVLAFRTADD